jgi:hypothetical protein
MQGRSLLRVPLLIMSALALVAAAGACGYDSQYVAPMDGRPRVVWGPGNDPAVEMAGAAPTGNCGAALRQITGQGSIRTMNGIVDLPSSPLEPGYFQPGYGVVGGVWAPRYYGPPIVIVTPGLAPRFLRPPIFSPSLLVSRSIVSSGGGFSGGGGGFRMRGGSGGGSGDAGKGVLILAALAIMVLPAIDIGLAAARPESSTKSAEATDIVNAWNDLMRSPGSPCSLYDAPPPPDAMPGAMPAPMPAPMPGGAS